ncbi:hypothetical protein OF83DRAFT_544543 [Amylostereum chailletii]|nr:hypothetical protein OF83DRAFT_544543 [Amylostereum chailletii]
MGLANCLDKQLIETDRSSSTLDSVHNGCGDTLDGAHNGCDNTADGAHNRCSSTLNGVHNGRCDTLNGVSDTLDDIVDGADSARKILAAEETASNTANSLWRYVRFISNCLTGDTHALNGVDDATNNVTDRINEATGKVCHIVELTATETSNLVNGVDHLQKNRRKVVRATHLTTRSYRDLRGRRHPQRWK